MVRSQTASEPRIAVLGAGVIGQVLAARLHAGGVDVALVARGRTRRRLAERGGSGCGRTATMRCIAYPSSMRRSPARTIW